MKHLTFVRKYLRRVVKANCKTIMTAVVLSLVVCSLSVSVFAADTDINEVLTTSFSEMVTSIIGTIGAILPIALGVMGLTVSIGFAVKWFKKLVGIAT